MSGDLQLVQSCYSGNAAYSHLIGATLEINRNIYPCNKCARESSQVPHLTHRQGQNRAPLPAVSKSALGQEKSKFRAAVPLDIHRLQLGPVLAGSALELWHWLHLNLQFREKPITKTSARCRSAAFSPVQ